MPISRVRRLLKRLFAAPSQRSTGEEDGSLTNQENGNIGDLADAPGENVAETDSVRVKSVASDVPISNPSQDVYGIDGFARALARSISEADASEGLVLAVNGAWGSGKSSACNLILHHLKDKIEAEETVPVTFNPWWFSGAEALTMSFFQELRVSVGKSLSDEARNAFDSLGTRVSSAGPLLGGLASLFATPAAGAAVTGAASLIGFLSKIDTTVEQEHEKLSKALEAQDKRFLVVIDDIDRLGTDDALQIFRLVKSVGRLPSVIYLLSFDRQLAEQMVSDRFPSEGPSYLEKVIQGAYDLPLPDPDDLKDAVLRIVDDVMGSPSEEDNVRYGNLFYDVVAPNLLTPRDAVRLSNAIRVSWPAVSGEVDRIDFLAIETLRVFLPSVHHAIRANPDMLCGAQPRHGGNPQGQAKQYEATFLGELQGRERELARNALLRLFPRMEAIWSNMWRTNVEDRDRRRLVCSAMHFPTYFRFSLQEGAISSRECRQLIEAAEDANTTVRTLRGFVVQSRRRGGTRAALALDELALRASEIDDDYVAEFLRGLFSIVDELDVEADRRQNFGTHDNQVRVLRIVYRLLNERLDQENRTTVLESACDGASLDWLVMFARHCQHQHTPEWQQNTSLDEPLVLLEASNRLCELGLRRLREASTDGSLLRHQNMAHILFRWRDLSGVEEVRAWTDQQLGVDQFVVSLAEQSIGTTMSQGFGFAGLGDRVGRRTDYVNLNPYSELVDIDRFRARVEDLVGRKDLNEEDRARLERFRSTPERDPGRDL